MPTLKPTKPTCNPTRNPTAGPSCIPSVAPTCIPSPAPTLFHIPELSFSATQTIYGIDKVGYDSSKADNDHTVKRAIAIVLQFGATEFNVFDITTYEATNSPSTLTTTNASKSAAHQKDIIIAQDRSSIGSLAGSPAPTIHPSVTSSLSPSFSALDYISITYNVRLQTEEVSYTTLSSAYTQSVTAGDFSTALQRQAKRDGNDPLLGCVSHSVYVRDTSQSSSSKKAGLSTSIIIIIVVAGVVVANLLVVLAICLYFKKVKRDKVYAESVEKIMAETNNTLDE